MSLGAALASAAAARHGGMASEALDAAAVAATAGGVALGATGCSGEVTALGSGGGAVRSFLVLGAGTGLGDALGDRGPAEDSSSLEVLPRCAASGSSATGRSTGSAVLGTATFAKGVCSTSSATT